MEIYHLWRGKKSIEMMRSHVTIIPSALLKLTNSTSQSTKLTIEPPRSVSMLLNLMLHQSPHDIPQSHLSSRLDALELYSLLLLIRRLGPSLRDQNTPIMIGS